MSKNPNQQPPFQRKPQSGRPPQPPPPGRRPAPPPRGAAPPPRGPAPAPRPNSSLSHSDSVQMTGHAGPGRKEPPPVVAQNIGDDVFSKAGISETQLEDGAKIVRYATPQKLGKLVQDAKEAIGGESSRFYGKGWVIGQRIAKISPDGKSVVYYPKDIAELVRDLLGPDSETI